MFLKTQVRLYAKEWIERLSVGRIFHLSELYEYLKSNFPDECKEIGYTADGKEPKFEKDARWAVQDAKHTRLIRRVTRGRWKRI
jgi:hypothetical protein